MKISYSWLQSYFKEQLPAPETLAELFTFRFAEVESIDAGETDSVLDVKVLPDRAHYALCHKGIASEISAITGMEANYPTYAPDVTLADTPPIRVEDPTLCKRYTARYITNVTAGESPAWLKDRLVAIGARPINVIVDALNYAMFDIGQPLHAFDADKITGSIVIRRAETGEMMTTLDGKEVTLTPDILVIADEVGVLAIAGIKGGTRAQVDASTKRIVLESAHFDGGYIRTASTKLGIRTDASKRYENEITPEWASIGSDRAAVLVTELVSGAQVGALTDVYTEKAEPRTLTIDPQFVSKLLGATIGESEIVAMLGRLGIAALSTADKLALTIPPERLDLVEPEDIVEEVGRIYGYENIAPIAPPRLATATVPLKSMYYEEKIRDTLIALGYSEIFTYSFTDTGSVEIEKSLASDKNFLRPDLLGNMREALERNAHNADLLGLSDVKLFEIGKVFDADGERLALALGVRKLKKEKGVTAETLLNEARAALQVIGITAPAVTTLGNDSVLEIRLDSILNTLSDASGWDLAPYAQQNVAYKKISAYPFMLRDIAIFVPVDTSEADISSLIKNEAGELLVRLSLFDIFTKTFPDGSQKTSYAFRLVFQSDEKTLSDAEANAIMERVNVAVAAKSWEVR